MKRVCLLLLALIPILLVTGCETVDRQDRAVLRAHNVPEDVYEKMLYGDPLTPDDVIVLSQRAVPPGLMIRYMRDTDLVYALRKADVKRMRAAGVSEEVIAYMLSTAPPSGPVVYRGGYGYPYGSPYPGGYPYAYGPYGPYGYYGDYYGGPVVFVGGYGRWGHGHGGWGHDGGHGHRR